MQQYFVSGKATKDVRITDKNIIRHMFDVMRLDVGDCVIFVFDDHIKRLAKVVDCREYRFQIIETLPSQSELPVDVTIAIGFPKGDKLEFLAQKATELGATRIWGFPADRSVVKWHNQKLANKSVKLAKISQGAAEQSKRNVIPKVTLFHQKDVFLEKFSQFDKIFIAYEEVAKKGEKSNLVHELSQMPKHSKILFVFGPEGGLSPEEITAFHERSGLLVGLGPRIMRTETAPLYALASISYALELEKSL